MAENKGKENKGNEPLSKTGASEKHQLFGYFGLNYSADWFHGSITGLSTT